MPGTACPRLPPNLLERAGDGGGHWGGAVGSVIGRGRLQPPPTSPPPLAARGLQRPARHGSSPASARGAAAAAAPAPAAPAPRRDPREPGDPTDPCRRSILEEWVMAGRAGGLVSPAWGVLSHDLRVSARLTKGRGLVCAQGPRPQGTWGEDELGCWAAIEAKLGPESGPFCTTPERRAVPCSQEAFNVCSRGCKDLELTGGVVERVSLRGRGRLLTALVRAQGRAGRPGGGSSGRGPVPPESCPSPHPGHTPLRPAPLPDGVCRAAPGSPSHPSGYPLACRLRGTCLHHKAPPPRRAPSWIPAWEPWAGALPAARSSAGAGARRPRRGQGREAARERSCDAERSAAEARPVLEQRWGDGDAGWGQVPGLGGGRRGDPGWR